MNTLRIELTPEQCSAAAPIRAASVATIGAGSILGELRRHPFDDSGGNGGGLYIDFVLIPAAVAAAIREAYRVAMAVSEPVRKAVSAKSAVNIPKVAACKVSAPRLTSSAFD